MSAFTENNAFNGLFPQIWSPLGSSLLVTNERAFLTVSILELSFRSSLIVWKTLSYKKKVWRAVIPARHSCFFLHRGLRKGKKMKRNNLKTDATIYLFIFSLLFFFLFIFFCGQIFQPQGEKNSRELLDHLKNSPHRRGYYLHSPSTLFFLFRPHDTSSQVVTSQDQTHLTRPVPAKALPHDLCDLREHPQTDSWTLVSRQTRAAGLYEQTVRGVIYLHPIFLV